MTPLLTSVRSLGLKLSLALTSTVAVLTAGATAAHGAVLVLPDFDDDVLGVDSYSMEYGDFDMDLRSARIDHQRTQVVITHTFDTLNHAESFDSLFVRFDTNGDWLADYTALYSPYAGTSGVVRGDLGEDGAPTCTTLGVAHTLGARATVTLTVPRSCLGNPSALAVNTTVFWAGYDDEGGEIYFADTAPGDALAATEYSASVAVERAVTVTPARSSKIVVGSRKPGRKPLTVKVTSLATPKGKLTLKVGGKKTSAQVTGKSAVKLKLPASLRKGSYRATITFTPQNSKVIKASRKVLTVTVR